MLSHPTFAELERATCRMWTTRRGRHATCQHGCRGKEERGTMASMAASAGTTARTWPQHAGTEWTIDMRDTLPNDGLRYGPLDGELIVSPAPTPRHQVARSELMKLLFSSCPRDHRVLPAPLDWQPDHRTSLQPDIVVLARDAYTADRVTGTPVLAIEVLSPT